MSDVPAKRMAQLIEPLATISLLHLDRATRAKLASNSLSVNAYPHASGGLVYVGAPGYATPTERVLAEIFSVAERAGVSWLLFDSEGGIVDGLTLFDDGAPPPPE